MKLSWIAVRFDAANKNSVPEKARGVYTFVVNPGIADHPGCAYLMYVGQTARQTLRDRFLQYVKEKAEGDQSRRPHVTQMLLKWDGFLWFYYAEIPDTSKIKHVEDELLTAYLPPCNRTFPSRIRPAIARLFAH